MILQSKVAQYFGTATQRTNFSSLPHVVKRLPMAQLLSPSCCCYAWLSRNTEWPYTIILLSTKCDEWCSVKPSNVIPLQKNAGHFKASIVRYTIASMSHMYNITLRITIKGSSREGLEVSMAPTGVAPRIFPLGADSSNEGAKIWLSRYYKCQKSPKKSLFTFRRG